MDEYWDSEDQWVEEARCIVCKTNIGFTARLVCSTICADLSVIRGSWGHSYDMEDDCADC